MSKRRGAKKNKDTYEKPKYKKIILQNEGKKIGIAGVTISPCADCVLCVDCCF